MVLLRAISDLNSVNCGGETLDLSGGVTRRRSNLRRSSRVGMYLPIG